MDTNFHKIKQSYGQRFAKFLQYFKANFRNEKAKEVQFLEKFIPPGGTIFDIGAEFGQYAKAFAKIHNNSCTVYSFEPFDYSRDILKKVVKKFKNVKIFSNAFLDKNTETKIYIPIKNSGKFGPGLVSVINQGNKNYVTQIIKTETLDSFAIKKNIKKIDFIKIDIEGAELLVFQGGIKSISDFRPIILCEINEKFMKKANLKVDDIFEFFFKLNYESFIFTNNQFTKVNKYQFPKDYIFAPKGININR